MRAFILVVHRSTVAVFAAAVTGLIAVDAVSWRRTRPFRSGCPSATLPLAKPRLQPRWRRASRTTFLAGAAGALACAYGITAPRIGAVPLVLVPCGGFVATTGLAARVRAVGAGRDGLIVRYAARPSFLLPWTECQELRPPGWLLDGWRVAGTCRSRSLMPSDLLGNEWVLATVIASAGLSFTGSSWVRSPPEERAVFSRPA
jgi:hypothetical protein